MTSLVVVDLGICIIGIHVILQLALLRGNDVDKSKSHFYEDKLNKLLKINYRNDPDVIEAQFANRGKKWMPPISHALISMLLVIAAIISLFIKT